MTWVLHQVMLFVCNQCCFGQCVQTIMYEPHLYHISVIYTVLHPPHGLLCEWCLWHHHASIPSENDAFLTTSYPSQNPIPPAGANQPQMPPFHVAPYFHASDAFWDVPAITASRVNMEMAGQCHQTLLFAKQVQVKVDGHQVHHTQHYGNWTWTTHPHLLCCLR